MKKLIIILGSFVAILIGGFLIFLTTFDVNQYKGEIIKVVEEKTGRSFSIDGELELAVSLIPTVIVEGVTLGNASWSVDKEMLKVGKFEAQVALLPLLSKNIEIKRLILNDASIVLEKNKEGVANWEFNLAKSTEAPIEQTDSTSAGDLPGLAVNEVRINNASLRYSDAVTKQSEKIVVKTFAIEASGFSSNMSIELDANYNDIPVAMNGKGGSLSSLLANDTFPLDMNASIGKINATIKGSIAKPKNAKGIDINTAINIDNLQDVGALIKQDLPNVGPVSLEVSVTEKDAGYLINKLSIVLEQLTLQADGKIADAAKASGININFELNVPELADLKTITGQDMPVNGPLKVSGSAGDSKAGYQVSDLTLTLGNNTVSGNASFNTASQPPALAIDLNSKLLDLSPYMPTTEKQEKKKDKNAKVFSSDPLPLEQLKSVNADIVVKADKIKLPDYELNKFAFDMKLLNGNLKINRFDADMFGGQLQSKVILNNNGKKGDLDLDIKLKDIKPELLPDMQDKISGAPTNISINGKGGGKSVAAIMAGLNGQLLITTGKGKLSDKAMSAASADVLMKTLSMINPGEKSDGSVLECAVVNFKVKDGMATADKGIAMFTQQLNILGSGTVNLKTEELDIGITPKAREGVGLSLGQLAELVRLGGTLANPTPKTDTKAALKTTLSAGAAVATGGLSILAQGLLDKEDSDQNPCDIALGKAPVKKKTATKEKTEEKSVVESTTDKVKESAGALGDKLKSLF